MSPLSLCHPSYSSTAELRHHHSRRQSHPAISVPLPTCHLVTLEQIGAEKVDIQNEKREYCLCWLPKDLLLIILSYVSILDYFSIRAVCKCWRAAFFEWPSSTIHQSEERRQLPWFLLLKIQNLPDKNNFWYEAPALYTTGKLGDLSTRRVYTRDIPELSGTRLLFSKYGWLLLCSDKNSSSSQLFFLNPFSKAKISLPFMDISRLYGPVFEISTPPQSPDCTVFVIGCVSRAAIEFSICRRGETAWTTKIYSAGIFLAEPIVNAVYVKGVFYCLHCTGTVSVVDAAGNCEWKDLGLPKGMRECYSFTVVSYARVQGDQVKLCVHDGVCCEIDLKEPLKISDLSMWELGRKELGFRTSFEKMILHPGDGLKVDSFNMHAWCIAHDSAENGMTFQWHKFRSFVDCNFSVKAKSCPSCTSVAWFEPVWVHPSPDLDWDFT